MKLVIAEKPSVARDIARVLGARRRRQGFIEGNGYRVTWALGHLIHFAEPGEYGGNWKGRWSFEQLPMVPQRWQLKTQKKTLDQYRVVAGLLKNPQTTEVICATDAGREGEHIFRLIYEYSGCRKPFKRLWISSLTDEAISAGFQRLQPGTAFDPLAWAARSRAQADWLVGLNLTRAYTVRHGALCTIGRVQTPTLGMIVRRAEEIARFQKAFYYELVADFREGFSAKYEENGKTRIDNQTYGRRLLREFRPEKTALVYLVEKKTKKFRPPPLYDLINLQKEGNQRFGLTAAQVLSHAQTLYETHKLISYPRTESRHISEDMVPQLPGILRGLDHGQATHALSRLEGGHKLGKAYVDRTKLSDHHGILPTGKNPSPSLAGSLKKVYDLVVDRFVGIFLPDHLVEETTAWLRLGRGTFKARGSLVVQEGWKQAERGRKKKEERVLPPLQQGQPVQVKALNLEEKETAAPKPYTDATLLNAMKHAGRDLEDDLLARAMKESGLGTPATRAEMIEKLIRTRLVERRKKALFPTAKGEALIKVADPNLKSAEMTGQWERRLKEIEEGKLRAETFNQSIVDFVRDQVQAVQRAPVLAMGALDEAGPKAKTRRTEKPQGTRVSAAKKTPQRAKTANGRTVFGACPACDQGHIIEGKTAYGCDRFRRGCQFQVAKRVAGKLLSGSQIRRLLASGNTNKLGGFKDDKGEKFSARLSLEQGNLVLNREPVEAEGPPACPKCGQGQIIEGQRGFGCNRFRQGCDFVIWKEVAGKKLTKLQIEGLLKRGRTRLIKGFKNKAGSSFQAYLVLDEDKRARFEFPKP